MHGTVRIGISGWTYTPWRGVFYPEKLPQKKELNFASTVFPTIEINGTFYSLQKPSSYEHWASEVPDDFIFAVKGTQFITHQRRLREVEAPLANFFASGLLKLGRKLGPILWQFPPSFKFDPEVLELFFALLPRDTHAAASIAEKHERWMQDRVFTESEEKLPVLHTVEVRDKSFAVPAFAQLLRKYKIAMVCADAVKWPRLMDVTSDFVYCRLHGSEELYASGYDAAALDQWAGRVAAWAQGTEPEGAEKADPQFTPERIARDVYVYFDNDAKVRAPFDAKGLIERVSELFSK